MQQRKNGFSASIKRGFTIIIGVSYRKWHSWRQRRHTLHDLRHLSDTQLKDIGLTRHDLDRFR